MKALFNVKTNNGGQTTEKNTTSQIGKITTNFCMQTKLLNFTYVNEIIRKI